MPPTCEHDGVCLDHVSTLQGKGAGFATRTRKQAWSMLRANAVLMTGVRLNHHSTL